MAPPESVETGKVAVGGDELASVLDRECGQICIACCEWSSAVSEASEPQGKPFVVRRVLAMCVNQDVDVRKFPCLTAAPVACDVVLLGQF
jgi:hypothetical protein